jgi:hypothetical protein
MLSCSLLQDELDTAARFAARPELAPVLADMRLDRAGLPPWGIAHVAADKVFYEPDPDGKPAIIVGAFEQGELIDLVATSLDTRAMRRRCGEARLLGMDWIERARDLAKPLSLFNDAFAWLAGDGCGAVVLDWRAAPRELADLRGLLCQSEALARRVTQAFARPVPLPPLYVHRSDNRPRESAHAV